MTGLSLSHVIILLGGILAPVYHKTAPCADICPVSFPVSQPVVEYYRYGCDVPE